MRRFIAAALIALTPVLATVPAGAAAGPESFSEPQAPDSETDLVSPQYDDGPIQLSALTEYSGDPLQIIVWPNDTRRYSLGDDRIGVYVCTWPGATGGVDLAEATSLLNNEVAPFYDSLSAGAYSPYFVARKTVSLDDSQSVWSDCENAMIEETNPLWDDAGAIGILDNQSNSGQATPGMYCFNCASPTSTTFPENGRWAIVEGETVKDFWGFGEHITTAAHELGHTISFPHSYSGEDPNDQYDNPIDYMSGNDPSGILGRRVEYPYSTLAFNRYRAGWVDPSDVVFYTGGVVDVTLAPIGVDGTQMVILPTGYQYSLLTLDARVNSELDPIPTNFEGVTAHYVEQWRKDSEDAPAQPVGGADSRVYTYPPSPYSLDHVTGAGEQLSLDLDQGEDLLAQGTLMKVLDQTEAGFQIRLIGFDDVAGSVFLGDVLWLAESGITKGCSDTSFCPTEFVTRGQMAAFLARALGYTDAGGGNLFTDDNGSVFEPSIDLLATAGVTKGCNPPVNDQFCPNDYVTREQMAAFLVRALDLADTDPTVSFDDTEGSVFTDAINKLATAGVTKGCNPPENTRFCPTDHVTREQMAAFLQRALG